MAEFEAPVALFDLGGLVHIGNYLVVLPLMVTVRPIASSVALFSQVSLTLCEGMLLCLAEISLFTCTDLLFSSLAMSAISCLLATWEMGVCI